MNEPSWEDMVKCHERDELHHPLLEIMFEKINKIEKMLESMTAQMTTGYCLTDSGAIRLNAGTYTSEELEALLIASKSGGTLE